MRIRSPVEVFTRDIYPPAQPGGLQAVFSSVGQKPFIDLTWAPNMESDLAGYNVYRWVEGGQPGEAECAAGADGIVSGRNG